MWLPTPKRDALERLHPGMLRYTLERVNSLILFPLISTAWLFLFTGVSYLVDHFAENTDPIHFECGAFVLVSLFGLLQHLITSAYFVTKMQMNKPHFVV